MCRWLLVAAALLLAGTSFAQQLVVRPQQAVLQPGQGQQFEAQLFDNAGRPVRGVTYTWSVEPNTLGVVTSAGYFIAGQEGGVGRVMAAAQYAGLIARGYAEVVVGTGRGSEMGMRLIVEPAEVVLAPGQTQQFRALIETKDGKVAPAGGVRWELMPPALGTITADGFFTAGNSPAVGQVVAQVTVERRLLRGSARVAIRSAQNALIRGRVIDSATGSPLFGAIVSVQGLGPLPWSSQDTTTTDGAYEVAVAAPGLYVVRAEAQGFVPEYYDNAQSLREATPISVTPSDTVSGIDFALGHGGAISGLVVAATDSAPLPGALVRAYSPHVPQMCHCAVADKNGRYVIGTLPAGSYVVEASAAGYRTEFYADAGTIREATLVEVVEADTTTGVDFYLASSSAITGRVVDAATGAPIALARVCAHIALTPDGRSQATALTDSSGNYTLAVRPGTYYVEARALDYATQWFDGVAERRLATPVTVVAEQHTSGIDFRLSRLGAITGLVSDQASGNPIAGAVVTAYREGPGAEASLARTDERGAYLICGLQPGNYFVRAVAEGYLAEWYREVSSVRDASLVAVAAGDTAADIDFTLSGGGSISGTVRSQDTGQPIAGARVEVSGATGPFMKVTFTGEDGAYAVTGLPSGSYFVQASAKDYLALYFDGVLRRAEATPVVVNAPEATTGIDFSLPSRLASGATIAGRVTDERTGEVLSGVRVFAVPLSPGAIHRDLTDSAGAYLLTGLQPGRYVVWAFKGGYLVEFYNNAQTWWQATPVVVKAGDQISGIDFSLAPQVLGPFALTGRVVDKDALPVSGAVVLAQQNGEVVASALCDESGAYVLDELPAGDYEVTVHGLYGQGETLPVTLTLNAQERLYGGVDFCLMAAPGAMSTTGSVPKSFALLGVYPNPFNPSTEVIFDLAQTAEVNVVVYNVLGQPVRTLLQGVLETGRHVVAWDGKDQRGDQLATGVYWCRLEARTPSGQRHLFVTKMVLAQ